MTYAIRRQIAHIEARDLRRFPPQLWPYVTSNTKHLVILAQAHGRMPKVADLDIPLTVRA